MRVSCFCCVPTSATKHDVFARKITLLTSWYLLCLVITFTLFNKHTVTDSILMFWAYFDQCWWRTQRGEDYYSYVGELDSACPSTRQAYVPGLCNSTGMRASPHLTLIVYIAVQRTMCKDCTCLKPCISAKHVAHSPQACLFIDPQSTSQILQDIKFSINILCLSCSEISVWKHGVHACCMSFSDHIHWVEIFHKHFMLIMLGYLSVETWCLRMSYVFLWAGRAGLRARSGGFTGACISWQLACQVQNSHHSANILCACKIQYRIPAKSVVGCERSWRNYCFFLAFFLGGGSAAAVLLSQ